MMRMAVPPASLSQKLIKPNTNAPESYEIISISLTEQSGASLGKHTQSVTGPHD